MKKGIANILDMKTEIKIALMGPQSTGKTTVAYNLAGALKKYYNGVDRKALKVGVVSEVARKSPFKINEASSFTSQLWIFNKQFLAEMEACKIYDLIICDRSVLDNIIYSQVYFKNKEYPFWFNFKAMQEMAKSYFKTYNLAYYFTPNNNAPVADGVRCCNLAFQHEIHSTFFKTLSDFKIDFKQYENTEKIIEDIKELNIFK